MELVKQKCFQPNSSLKRRGSVISICSFHSSFLGSQKRGPGALERAPSRNHPGTSPAKSFPVWIWSQHRAQNSTGDAQSTNYFTQKRGSICEELSFWACHGCECVVWCLCSELRISLGVLRSVPRTWVGSRTDLDQQIKWPNVPELWAGRKWLPLKALLTQPLSEQKSSFAHPLSIKTLSYFTAAEITSVNNHLSYNRQIFTCHFLAGRPKICISRIFFPPHLWKVISVRLEAVDEWGASESHFFDGCLLCKSWGYLGRKSLQANVEQINNASH